ncbi:MAG TPA: LysE family transporter, partial [Bacillota bacterium]|nr:LysE family transporter [Bacillota bacterium]
LKSQELNLELTEAAEDRKTFLQGFNNGFLCNILNPKAFLFFLSIFSQFLTPTTPGWVKWLYGLEIGLAVGGWFTILSIMISSRFFKETYQKVRSWIDRLLGGLLLYYAYRILRAVFS